MSSPDFIFPLHEMPVDFSAALEVLDDILEDFFPTRIIERGDLIYNNDQISVSTFGTNSIVAKIQGTNLYKTNYRGRQIKFTPLVPALMMVLANISSV